MNKTEDKICAVYKGKDFKGAGQNEVYVFVEKKHGLSKVPQELLDSLGGTKEIMTLMLNPDKKLARAKASDVLKNIEEKGYYLQLPPDYSPKIFTLGE